MREVVVDTETTGLNHEGDDRIVEIGCVELLNYMPTGQTFHSYVNPERDMPEGAFRVHGLSADFLRKHPVFSEIVDDFMNFLGDAPLIIHNAEFDLGFINAELQRLGRTKLPGERAIDTVKMARRKFPGAQAGLDALCRRFNIDISDRELHGAIKDSHLLAKVYLELVGGRQQNLGLAAEERIFDQANPQEEKRVQRAPRAFAPTGEEKAAHQNFILKLKSPIWSR